MLLAQSRHIIKSALSASGGAVAQLAFPPTCAGCRRIVAEPGTLCAQCWPQLRFLERPWCDVFGTPMAFDLGQGFVSAAAIADPPPFDKARAAVSHEGIAKRMVHDLKYRDRTDLARWMAKWMARAGASIIADSDVVVPIPLHRRRFFLRRYNQSAELARAVAREAGLPFQPEALVRTRPTRSQVGLAGRERHDNVRGAFAVPDESNILVQGRAVLLIDDVYTTGATVAAAARALKKRKAARIHVLTFSRVLHDD